MLNLILKVFSQLSGHSGPSDSLFEVQTEPALHSWGSARKRFAASAPRTHPRNAPRIAPIAELNMAASPFPSRRLSNMVFIRHGRQECRFASNQAIETPHDAQVEIFRRLIISKVSPTGA